MIRLENSNLKSILFGLKEVERERGYTKHCFFSKFYDNTSVQLYLRLGELGFKARIVIHLRGWN